MPNLFSKIHRLKSQGWTWDQFLSELDLIYPGGMDEKTLKSHYRQPHKGSTSHTQQLIETLHKQYFPSPFPADIDALMRVYNNLLACPKHVAVEHDIADLQVFLNAQLLEPCRSVLRTARLHWLTANTYFDSLAELRSMGKTDRMLASQQQAVQHFEQAVSLLEAYNNDVDGHAVSEFILYKLRQNILACYLNAVPPEQRESDGQVLHYLSHSDFLAQTERVLKQEPYLWVVARNGLRFASLLKSKEYCDRFFSLLVASSAYFEDLTYAPQGYPAISESKEFCWACENINGESKK